ncbi:hypothetical protein HJFPF1_06818 [Paramyrothecium foliicola]|nr:hypothetical protein HJFPF1_06818 [Paramyrothecium foliicola]
MTTPQQPAKGAQTGRKRPLTYGKASRRIPSATSSTDTASCPDEAVSGIQANLAKEKPRSAPIAQSKSTSIQPVVVKHAQGRALQTQFGPQLNKGAGQIEDASRDHLSSFNIPPINRNGKGKGKVLNPPERMVSEATLEPGSSLSFAHRQKQQEDVKRVSLPSAVIPPIPNQLDALHHGNPNQSTQDPTETSSRKRTFSATKPRRPRLIDALSAQKRTTSDSDSSPSDDASGPWQSEHNHTPRPRKGLAGQDIRQRQDHRSKDTPKRRKVKYTYSQSRSFIGDSQSSQNINSGESDPLLLESLLSETSKPTSPGAFDFPDDSEDDTSKTAIRSVHELRRAGAHNRFADEMEDLLFRIGTPNCDALTMRRNALMELATKLDSADFTNQFRNHAARDSITKGIGDEEDMICAIALAAALVIFLSSGPAPHLLRQMAEDHVGKFLGRMLRVHEDIDNIAALKSTNMSKTSRITLSRVKDLLMKMRIWHGYGMPRLSPRDLGLQLLEMFFRVSEPQHLEMVADELETDLAQLAEHYSGSSSQDSVGIALIVSIFEAQTSATTALSEKPATVHRLVPLIVKLLPKALQSWMDAADEFESNTLKLATNLTNTEAGAAAFDDASILTALTNCIRKGMSALSQFKGDNRMPKRIHDGLLLILGVMINIMEHCVHARRSVSHASIDDLANLYLESQLSMTETENAGNSQLTVPFGYLSVLLGYLSLAGPARAQISAQIKTEGTSNLVETIQQLIVMYRQSGNDAHELESLVNELRIRYRP